MVKKKKNSPANAGDIRDMDFIPGSGRSSGVGNGNTPVFLPGKSRGQRSLGRLQFTGSKRVQLSTTQQQH